MPTLLLDLFIIALKKAVEMLLGTAQRYTRAWFVVMSVLTFSSSYSGKARNEQVYTNITIIIITLVRTPGTFHKVQTCS